MIILFCRILVQFDGNQYGIDQIGAQIPVNVYRSTTIRELRAIVGLTLLFKTKENVLFSIS